MTPEELRAYRAAQRGEKPRKLPAKPADKPTKPKRQPPPADEVAGTLGLDAQMLRTVLDGVNLGHLDPLGPQAAQCITLRILGFSALEIASHLSLKIETVRVYLYEARRRGKLMDVAPLLDSMALPQAVDNIVQAVNDNNLEVSLAVAKGRGAFRAFEKHDTDAHLGLSIKFEGFAPDADGGVVEGSIVGAPALPPSSSEN